ncbi:MFS transporter [Halospeciosus flavus]|uniref:MFS transporter n=1 Tax=Halospeciosus flavus TaxID=3032283 RepID=A0ABD5Z4C1_9EURY|nr:MFS transporter [Halospeciosus flavus]
MSANRERVALALVVFAVLLAQVLLYPGIDVLVAALGADTRLDASMWFLATEFAAFVLFAPVWGALSDATGERAPFVLVGALGGAAGYALLAVVPTVASVPFWAVLVLRFCQGATTIAAFSLAMTMLMDLGGGHGRNMGAAGIAIGLGTALGAPLGGRLYEVGAFVPLYAASVLLFGVAFLCLVVTDRAGRAERGGRRDVAAAVASLRRRPELGVPYAFGFIDRLTAGFFALVGTLYFRDVFGLDPGATGLTLALFFAPFALLQYPFGRLSDRVGRTLPIVVGSTLYGVAVLGVGLAPTVGLAQAGMVLVGVVGAFMAPATMALVTDLAAPDERGVAMAGFNVAGSVGFLAGIVVGGTVADHYGYLAAFAVVGGLEILLAAVALPPLRRMETDRTATFDD